MSEARSWSDTPLRVADSRQDLAAVFTPRGKGRLPVMGGILSGWLVGYQGYQLRGTPLTAPWIRTITS